MMKSKVIKKGEYEIHPNGEGIFIVRNIKTQDVYRVDTFMPFCSCPAFLFTKEDKNGRKVKNCKHLAWCLGLKNRNI